MRIHTVTANFSTSKTEYSFLTSMYEYGFRLVSVCPWKDNDFAYYFESDKDDDSIFNAVCLNIAYATEPS